MLPRPRKPMDGAQLDAALIKLFNGNSQRERSILFAEIIACDNRTVRKWISGEAEVPRHIAMLVNAMLDYNIKPEELRP